MNPHTMGILIGGIGAAVFFGVGNVFVKSANQAGISSAQYLVWFGVGSAALGFLIMLFVPSERTVTLQGGSYAALHGVLGGLGLVAVSYALEQYAVSLSVINPIYNANTLITVLLSLVLFAEWKGISVTTLLIGAVLIIVGSVFVARA